VAGTAFTVPLVASFSMDGLSLYEADAQLSNMTGD
jgi:Na+/H+-dicarboxylate symporter